MDLFDIVGPIMVGPSSSHTAGAVRIGYIAGQLLGEPLKEAQIQLYGSFLATGEGHGTKKAIVAVHQNFGVDKFIYIEFKPNQVVSFLHLFID